MQFNIENKVVQSDSIKKRKQKRKIKCNTNTIL